MARIAVNLAVIFSLLIISQARTPFNLPANEFQPSTTSSESDITVDPTLQTLHLPSEKSEVEQAVPIENVPKSDPTIINVVGVTQPLTYDVSFRPINRHLHHISANRPLWFSFRHRCRHHRHHEGEPMVKKLLTGLQEIPYGNDMLMARDETTFHQIFHGEEGQIPARWGQKHHHHGKRFRFPGKSFVVNGEENAKKFEHLYREEIKKKEKEGGFVKRFRKFLSNHF